MKERQRRATARGAALAVAAFLSVLPAGAQEDADRLAEQLSNPVASLISVPFQWNTDFGYGEDEGTRTTLNIQPVLPFSLNAEWNLIARVILPVVYQDDLVPDTDQLGLGDTTPTLFFSPKAGGPGGIIWAVGPVFLLPTATDDRLGAEQWGLGPSFLVLKQAGHRTYGVLTNHIESVEDRDDRPEVSNTFLQPFFARQFSGGRTLTLNSESSYDWERGRWTAPVNVVYSKVTKMGSQMLSFAGGARAYVERPEGGPDWGLRFVVTLLFPAG